MSGHDLRDDYDDQPWKRRFDPADLVHWPALLLGAFGTLQLALSIAGCVWLPGALVWNWIDPEFFNNDGPQWPEVVVGTTAFAICVGLNWLIVVGTRRLGKFRSYRTVVWAVAVSFLPLPFVYCGVVTIPISIWALAVVLNPDVRARFEAVARGTINLAPPEARDARRTDAS